MPRSLLRIVIGLTIVAALIAVSSWGRLFPYWILRVMNIKLIPVGDMYVTLALAGGLQQLRDFEDYKLLERVRDEILLASPGSIHSCSKEECLTQFPALSKDDVWRSLLIVDATSQEISVTTRSKSVLYRAGGLRGAATFSFVWRSGKPHEVDLDFSAPKVPFMVFY